MRDDIRGGQPHDKHRFENYNSTMAGEAWSDAENDIIVADYFAMLMCDIAATPYSKAAHNRELQTQLDRPRGAIEFKHQNISAVLKALGEDWIIGYKPAFNFQATLVDAVARYLARNQQWRPAPLSTRDLQIAEEGVLFIDSAPTIRNAPPPDETERSNVIARQFDVAARDERNRSLGEAGERRVLAHERAVLTAARRTDLAQQVRWVSKEDGDGAGYDIASFERDGTPRLIEVKTTTGWERTPFYISRNEIAVSKEKAENWLLMRLWNFTRAPKAFEVRPPLERHVELLATSFEARFH